MLFCQFDALDINERNHIIGAQGCIWTEWTKDSLKMEWQMMPRIAALSERQWSNPEQKNLSSFLSRLHHQLKLYSLHGYHYKQDIYEANINVEEKKDSTQAEVTMVTFDNAPVYYSLDGSEPTQSSTQYTEPFIVKDSALIKAIAVRMDGEPSPISVLKWKVKDSDKSK